MRSVPATIVACSVCGKTLRGTMGVLPGFHVNPHKNEATGKGCLGKYRTDHQPKAVSDVR